MRAGGPVRHRHPGGPGRPAPVTVGRVPEPGNRPADQGVPPADPGAEEDNTARPRPGHPGRMRRPALTHTCQLGRAARVQGGPASSGITAVTRVPWPRVLVTVRVPPRV